MSDNCLTKAHNIVHGDRNVTYGDPKQNHETTAALFSEFMRRRYGTFPELTPEDVCWFNVCQKMSREAHCKTDDGMIDICGYVANVEIVRKGWSISEGKAAPVVMRPLGSKESIGPEVADYCDLDFPPSNPVEIHGDKAKPVFEEWLADVPKPRHSEEKLDRIVEMTRESMRPRPHPESIDITRGPVTHRESPR